MPSVTPGRETEVSLRTWISVLIIQERKTQGFGGIRGANHDEHQCCVLIGEQMPAELPASGPLSAVTFQSMEETCIALGCSGWHRKWHGGRGLRSTAHAKC